MADPSEFDASPDNADHDRKVTATANNRAMAKVVRWGLEEDLDDPITPDRDRTAAATVPEDVTVTARFMPRKRGIVAGTAAIIETYELLDPRVSVEIVFGDGEETKRGQAIAVVSGPARSIFAGERTALNLLTHLTGIATHTRAFVDAVDGTDTIIRDTRKTLPGFREIQKQAVIAGGGVNHRMSLRDQLLVKDNHVAAAGGIREAASAALAAADGRVVQVEVDSLGQLTTILDLGVEHVLLDNFSVEGVKEGVRRCRAARQDVYVEASGGVTLKTVREIAMTGVDSIAVGALTHSSVAVDIGLDIEWHSEDLAEVGK